MRIVIVIAVGTAQVGGTLVTPAGDHGGAGDLRPRHRVQVSREVLP